MCTKLQDVNSHNSVTNKHVVLFKFYQYSLPRDQTHIDAFYAVEKFADSLKSIGSPIAEHQVAARVTNLCRRITITFGPLGKASQWSIKLWPNCWDVRLEAPPNLPRKSDKSDNIESAYAARPNQGMQVEKKSKIGTVDQLKDNNPREGDFKLKPHANDVISARNQSIPMSNVLSSKTRTKPLDQIARTAQGKKVVQGTMPVQGMKDAQGMKPREGFLWNRLLHLALVNLEQVTQNMITFRKVDQPAT